MQKFGQFESMVVENISRVSLIFVYLWRPATISRLPTTFSILGSVRPLLALSHKHIICVQHIDLGGPPRYINSRRSINLVNHFIFFFFFYCISFIHLRETAPSTTQLTSGQSTLAQPSTLSTLYVPPGCVDD